MSKITFPNPFHHGHPPVQNVHDVFESQLTFGQHLADKVAHVAGSWRFIVAQTAILALWVALNITAYIKEWDPYPFILLNLLLSLQAAYTAPVIMISQNRQAARDRVEANCDYQINLKAEEEVRAILEHLHAQNAALAEIHSLLQSRQGLP